MGGTRGVFREGVDRGGQKKQARDGTSGHWPGQGCSVTKMHTGVGILCPVCWHYSRSWAENLTGLGRGEEL